MKYQYINYFQRDILVGEPEAIDNVSDFLKERLEYTVQKGVYVGQLTNFPFIICKSESLELLISDVKEILRYTIERTLKTLNSNEPFFLKDNTTEWQKHKTNEK